MCGDGNIKSKSFEDDTLASLTLLITLIVLIPITSLSVYMLVCVPLPSLSSPRLSLESHSYLNNTTKTI